MEALVSLQRNIILAMSNVQIYTILHYSLLLNCLRAVNIKKVLDIHKVYFLIFSNRGYY